MSRATRVVLLLVLGLPLSAATITVTNTNDSGPGSLREALTQVNTGTYDRVEFSIGTGQQRIQPLTNLPYVYPSVVIDGRTQPGYSGKPLIEIDGSLVAGNWSSVSGLSLARGDVYGLVINNFVGAAIRISGGSVRNCYIGTDASGMSVKRNQRGITTHGFVTIGGTGATDGNLISGNYVGIEAGAALSVQGNTFGGNATLTAAIDPSAQHVSVQYVTSGVSAIGGEARNVFVGGERGVDVFYSNNVRISRNYFGTTPGGASMPIRNAIDIYQSSTNVVSGNFIHNSEIGVSVSGNSLRNRILENSIYNSGLGIDLRPSYEYPYGLPTPNDATDEDTGPNNLVNFPILGRVKVENGQTKISGTVSTIANRTYRIEIYRSPSCNASGYGEGKTLLEGFEATSDTSGQITFTRTLPALAPGTIITATTTSDLEGTSEFSRCAVVEGPGAFSFQSTGVAVSEGGSRNVVVRRQNGAVGAASVSYAPTGGTATAADFAGATGTLMFGDGETAKSFTVQTTGDSNFEGHETIVLALSGATNGTSIEAPSTITLTIIDDDPPPHVTLESVSVPEGDSGSNVVHVPISLSMAVAAPLNVSYSVHSSWAATPGEDFISHSGTVTFAPGETAKSIPVTILGDTRWEDDESLWVEVSSPNWTSASVTIVNDDPMPVVEAEDLVIAEGNANSTASVTLRASQPVSGWVYVTLVGGTANAGSDFTPRAQSIYFPNTSTRTFEVPLLGDDEPEPDESFTVKVMAQSTHIRGADGVVTILNDDVGVGPAERWIPVGTSQQFTVRLAMVMSEEVTVGLTSDEPSAVSVPATLLIPAGQLSGNFSASALVPGRNAKITVTLPPSTGGSLRSVRVRTYSPASLHFSPSRMTMFEGTTATVSVSLDPPSTTATTIGLEAAGAADASRSITIPPAGSASFVVTARRIGPFTITAQLPSVHGNELQSLYGEVLEEPETPAIVSITPSHGPTAGGTEVTVHGVNLRNDCSLSFGGVPAASQVFQSGTAMTAVTPPHAGGSVPVSLSCGSDAFVLPNGFGYVSASPHVSVVEPATGTTAGGTFVRIGGTHFDGTCWLFFGRTAATDVVVRDAATMTGVAPPRAAGTSDVAVRCSGGTSTLAAAFVYRTDDDPPPFITGVVPSAAAPGELVTIHGLNFRPADTSAFETAPAMIVDPSPTAHVVQVPELPAGPASVSVRDDSGRVTTTGPVFSILEARPPRITSVSPSTVAAGAELELIGEGFRAGYTFEIGGRPATIVSREYTHAILRIAGDAATGSQTVNVRNSAGALAAIGPAVEIAGDGLLLTSAHPRCALTDGGVFATLRGRGFTPGATVAFDGIPAVDVTFLDHRTLRVLVPPGAAGSARISVTDSGGPTTTLTNGFRYASPFDPRACTPRTRTVRH